MKQLSNCHKAPVTVDTADEGTSCFMCSECNRPCDLAMTDEHRNLIYPAIVAALTKQAGGHLVVEAAAVDEFLGKPYKIGFRRMKAEQIEIKLFDDE